VFDTDYALIRNGNYIEHYEYEDYQDRYTYFNVNLVELINIMFGEFMAIEIYNDELYPSGTEYIPYSNRYFVMDDDQMSGIIEEYYETETDEWFVEIEEFFTYEGTSILEVEINVVSDEGSFPYLRNLFTYGQSTNTEVELSPASISLHQNYPNPFNPATIISYKLDVNSTVKLSVYDVLGRELAVLVNGRQGAGNYEIRFDGASFPTGMYFYRLETADKALTRSMMLIK
jgi:hypothetical protein